MRYKKTYNVDKHIDNEIVKGDLVKFWDGSGISIDGVDEIIYIVLGFPEIFGTSTIIKELVFEVVETNIDNKIIKGEYNFYLQDIALKLVNSDANLVVRTPSNFVKKV